MPRFRPNANTPFPNALKAARHLAKVDPRLAPVIEKVGRLSIDLDPGETIFESLACSIVYQQLHGKAAATILARFRGLFGENRADFPEAAEVLALTDEAMRAVGLSRNKAKAMRNLARMVLDGVIPPRAVAEDLDDEALIEAVTRVPGIGRWTAQMLLIFTLGRPDVMPSTDFGVRAGFRAVYRKRAMPTPKALEKHAERWRPYRSAGAWYLWRALELEEFKGRLRKPRKKSSRTKSSKERR